MEVFNKLPDWLKEKIQGNLEFEGSKLQELLSGAPKTAEKPQKEAPKKQEEPAEEAEGEEDAPW